MDTTFKKQSTPFIPLTISQIVFAIRQLSKNQLELLEIELDQDFADEVLRRGQTVWQEYKQGNTLNLDQLKKELALRWY
jgi:hypothetical protein